MGKPIDCRLCNKEFGIFRWRYECVSCGKTICSDCSVESDFIKGRFCNNCSKNIAEGISSMKVVRSEHVGGHKIIRSYPKVDGISWRRNQQNSVDNIKYQAYKLGANAIVSLDIKKKTESESGSGAGTHYYSVFLASGIPVVIEKRHDKGKTNTNMTSEIERLVKLMELGHITQDEFYEMKKKIIG